MTLVSEGWSAPPGDVIDAASYVELFEHSIDAVLLTRPDGTILAANPSACGMLRATEAEICAMGRSAIADLADDRWRIGLQERASTGRTQAQVRMRRADGTIFEAALTSSIYRTEGGDLRACTIFRDVTSDVEVLRALAESESRWRTTVDHAPIGIALVGLDGRWLSVNGAVCEIVGYPEDELLALTFQDITHPDDLDADLALLGQLVAGAIPRYEMEKRYLRADGTEIPIRLSVSLVRDEHGAPVHFVSQIQDIRAERAAAAALREANARLQELATTDVLTGLPNRALLSDRLDQAIALAEREGWDVAVLFVDLDRFKQVNDSLGHHCGDELLAEVARRISGVLRESDTVARLGGDEFAILLSGSTSAEEAAATAERVLACFASSFSTGGTEVFGTASIGVAMWPQDCTTKSELLQHADLAMYRAKAAGGASFEMFQPIMTLAVRQQLQMRNDLRRAVDAGELFLRYHP